MAYFPLVRNKLKEIINSKNELNKSNSYKLKMIYIKENCEDSNKVRKYLNKWLKKFIKMKKKSPQNEIGIIHFNCGLHDIKVRKAEESKKNTDKEVDEIQGSADIRVPSSERKDNPNRNQVSISEYADNLEYIVRFLKSNTNAELIWASTTPVIYERHHRNKDFDRYLEDVEKYNRVATEIMEKYSIEINDLFSLIRENNPDECIKEDGVHMTDIGNKILAEAVTSAILKKINEIN